ncbi:hypothetical protein C8Q73DRAFT_786813 [Cubamyces lactineus]|nr:hypothetical protein C8Q73DRAFT_786813 [Cubamyces lactineus]
MGSRQAAADDAVISIASFGFALSIGKCGRAPDMPVLLSRDNLPTSRYEPSAVMSQKWMPLDLDERVFLEGTAKLDDHIWNCNGFDLNAIRIPCTNENIDKLLKGRFVLQRTAPLFRLPPELLHQILQLLNPTNAYVSVTFFFAMTCKLALAVARSHIVRIQRSHFGSLAGHRLICIGDAARTFADYPRGLFTDKEKREWFNSSDGEYESDDIDLSLFALAASSWQRVREAPSLIRTSDLVWRRSAISCLSTRDFLFFRALSTPHYPDDAQWVVCNLSKREYLRYDAIPPVRNKPNPVDAQSRKVNLCRLVFACICWSPSKDTGIRSAGGGADAVNAQLARGRWAGDRLEMTTLEKMAPCEGAARWKDVTEDLLRLLHELWVSKMGDPRRCITLEIEYREVYGVKEVQRKGQVVG